MYVNGCIQFEYGNMYALMAFSPEATLSKYITVMFLLLLSSCSDYDSTHMNTHTPVPN